MLVRVQSLHSCNFVVCSASSTSCSAAGDGNVNDDGSGNVHSSRTLDLLVSVPCSVWIAAHVPRSTRFGCRHKNCHHLCHRSCHIPSRVNEYQFFVVQLCCLHAGFAHWLYSPVLSHGAVVRGFTRSSRIGTLDCDRHCQVTSLAVAIVVSLVTLETLPRYRTAQVAVDSFAPRRTCELRVARVARSRDVLR